MPRLGLGSSLTGGAAPEAPKTLASASAVTNGYSLLFDASNDYLTIGDDSAIDDIFSGGGSVSLWYRYEGTGSGSGYGKLICKDGATSNKGWQIFHYAEGRLFYQFTAVSGGGVTDAKIDLVHSAGDDVWRNMVCVYDTDNIQTAHPTIYIDGSVVAPVDDAVKSEATDAYGGDDGLDLFIGNKSGADRGWAGGIDEVSFWDRELTSSEVTSLYNSRTPTDLEGIENLVGWWRMEENTGTTVADSSENSNSGTITNATFDSDTA